MAKKVLILLPIILVFIFYFILFSISGSNNITFGEIFILTLTLLVLLYPLELILFMLIRSVYQRKKSQEEVEKIKDLERRIDEKILEERSKYLQSGYFKHITGLPLAEDYQCKVMYCPDKICIDTNGFEFNLPLTRISDMSIKTDIEISNTYTSSAGGAVGGALLFGPVGAMIGGRVKKKESKTIEQFLIITYEKEENIQYLVFDVTDNFANAKKMMGLFNSGDLRAEKKIMDL